MNPILPTQHFVPDVEARQWRYYLFFCSSGTHLVIRSSIRGGCSI
ncbi:MAG: hypothetical protein R6W76_14470 [Caldilinea sp.]